MIFSVDAPWLNRVLCIVLKRETGILENWFHLSDELLIRQLAFTPFFILMTESEQYIGAQSHCFHCQVDQVGTAFCTTNRVDQPAMNAPLDLQTDDILHLAERELTYFERRLHHHRLRFTDCLRWYMHRQFHTDVVVKIKKGRLCEDQLLIDLGYRNVDVPFINLSHLPPILLAPNL